MALILIISILIGGANLNQPTIYVSKHDAMITSSNMSYEDFITYLSTSKD